MTLSLVHGLGCLVVGGEGPPLVRHREAHGGDDTAARELAVRHIAYERYRLGLSPRPAPDGAVCWGCCQQATGEEDGAGEAVPEVPQPLRADRRWQASEGQHAPALDLGEPWEARGGGERESEQCVVAGEPLVPIQGATAPPRGRQGG